MGTPAATRPRNCVRWKGVFKPPGAAYLARLVDTFGAENIGILTGRRSGVFIVDIDAPELVDAMVARFGDTPLHTATTS